MLDAMLDLNSGYAAGGSPTNDPSIDHAARAIQRMRSAYEVPRDYPQNVPIICVDVTNRCDLQCSNCTRLLANQREHWDMTPENFRLALQSLRGFQGVIAMIGGNPCVSPHFAEYCQIFAEEVPVKRQRGLWSNNVLRHQQIIADTFGFFNLNPHGDERGTASLDKLRELIPGLHYYKGHSKHSPLMAAVQDAVSDDAAMWDAIANCDINRNWSASIVQNQGQLRAYFCEVAASFDLARGEDHGKLVVEGWWRQHISAYSDQVKKFCPGCGVPARLKKRLDIDETDDYSETNADIALRTRGKRKTNLLKIAQRDDDRPVTDYSEEHRTIPVVAAPSAKISVVIPCYNASTTIRDTIASVVTQEVPPGVQVEVIISDDGSKDDSREIVERAAVALSLSSSHASIRLLPPERNGGPSVARNRGLRHATGDYVCFLDADDCYAPGFFKTALQILSQQHQFAGVMTDLELVNLHRPIDPVQLQTMAFSVPSNIMIRKSVVDVIGGFPEDIAFRGPSAGEDVAFKQVLTMHFMVGYVQQPFLRYRVVRGSHFDFYLDSTRVVDGKLEHIRQLGDADARLGDASRRYGAAVAERIRMIDGTRNKRMAAAA